MRFLRFFIIAVLPNTLGRVNMTENRPQQSQIVTESSNNDEDTSTVRTTITQGGRIKWTEKMCIALIMCGGKAEELCQSENCPRKENGRKEGKMNLLLHFWNAMGYSYLKRTAGNLRDKLARINKSTQVSSEQIANEIGRQQLQIVQSTENQNFDPDTSSNTIEHYANCQPEEGVNNFDQNDEEYKLLLQKHKKSIVISLQIRVTGAAEKIILFSIRKLLSKTQSIKLQNIAYGLLNANPTENPEVFLWEYNCAIYATVISFKSNNEKNKSSSQPEKTNKQSEKPKWMINIENKMTVHRKRISQLPRK